MTTRLLTPAVLLMLLDQLERSVFRLIVAELA